MKSVIGLRILGIVSFTGKEPSNEEKGTLKNPFDNVYEAVNYLAMTEREAYKQDSLMNNIANMQYFYNPNQGCFLISWASPYVAHQKNNFPKNAFMYRKWHLSI